MGLDVRSFTLEAPPPSVINDYNLTDWI